MKRRYGYLGLAIGGLLVLIACGQASPGAAGGPTPAAGVPAAQITDGPAPIPTATLEPGALPPPLQTATAAALPTLPPPPTRTPAPPAPPPPTLTPIVIAPRSTPVVPGRAYDFNLYTHCGIDYAVDFAGSFWDWVGRGNYPRDLGNPDQQGTMTLLDPDHARFDYPGGSLDFTRHHGPKTIPGFCM